MESWSNGMMEDQVKISGVRKEKEPFETQNLTPPAMLTPETIYHTRTLLATP